MAKLRNIKHQKATSAALIVSKTRQITELKEVLTETCQGLNDWLVTYAWDFCDPEDVEAARNRLNERGTIAYITDITSKARNLLKEIK